MAYRRSLDFLPQVFRTETNDKFLRATLDQLISEPELKRVDGYIGRRLNPSAKPTDGYVNELNNERQNYQLEGTTVYLDNLKKIKFAAGYTDLLSRINSYGGFTDDHSRLFESDAYNYDGLFDYDKFLNYTSYYWLPNGPDPVSIYSRELPTEQTFNVIPPVLYQFINGQFSNESFDTSNFDVTENPITRVRGDGIKFDVTGTKINPIIRLARGGTYTFNVEQTGHGFYIQTQPGTNESLNWQKNLSSRDVFGVENNGEDIGSIKFSVPKSNAQDFFIEMEKTGKTDLVAYSGKRHRQLFYKELQYKSATDLLTNHNGIDDQRFLEGKTIIFLADPASEGNVSAWQSYTEYREGDLVSYGDSLYRVLTDFKSGRVFSATYLETYDYQDNWYNPEPFDNTDVGFDMASFDRGQEITYEQRRGTFVINIDSDGLIKLTPQKIIAKNKKYDVLDGTKFGNRAVYRDSNDIITVVPTITANIDKLYYADSLDPNIGGIIELIDQDNNVVLDVNNILGQTSYRSPNGVEFTNGLKIRFLDDVVPASYVNKMYYVEGVGTSIKLIDIEDLATVETFLDLVETPYDVDNFDAVGFSQSQNAPINPDYIVINRASADQNAWTRTNRWFHSDIITLTAKYNNYVPKLDNSKRAKRPIIEFDPNIQLYNYGYKAKKAVNHIDTVTDDAFSKVEGRAVQFYTEDGNQKVTGYYVDDSPLTPGNRVIFAADTDPDVRNRIYEVSWIQPQGNTENKSWSFKGDGVTKNFDLNFSVYDPVRLTVTINGVVANQNGYFWNYTQGDYISFAKAPPDKANISVFLTFDYQIHLTPTSDSLTNAGETVLIKQGLTHQGSMYYYTGSQWILAQEKNRVNQSPHFNLYDRNLNSFGDTSVYPSSNFTGTKIFAYQTGAGHKDPVLGLRLKYRNVNNLGDILFEDHIAKGSFIYRKDLASITKMFNTGRLLIHNDDGSLTYRNQWVKTNNKARQYQTQTYYATMYQQNLFELNVIPEAVSKYIKNNLLVFVNNNPYISTKYDLQREDNRYYILFDEDLNIGDKIDIKIYSKEVKSNSVFETPISFDHNPRNEPPIDITLGEVRSHILKSYTVNDEIVGDYIGFNNVRDLGKYKEYIGGIVQHAGSSHVANLLLNDKETNFVDAILYANREYKRFKNRFIQLASDLRFTKPENISICVDEILTEIALNKNPRFAFFASDMAPFGNDYVKLEYLVTDSTVIEYDLSTEFNLDSPSDKAILVYLNKTLLILGQDYLISNERPGIILNIGLSENDLIEIREYNTTDGGFIPPTPTKLGMYPKFNPAIVLDGYGEASREMIRGHDGSLIARFNDFRDDFILEFEKRVFNNLKVVYNENKFNIYDYIPGAFRSTRYSKEEYTAILGTHFATWSGTNGLAVSDYRQFDSNDPFTWNYGRFTNRIDKTLMPASHWRGLYLHYYDTTSPHLRPWEMLGFSEMPDWWIAAYGPAPYTAGNKTLWDDLEAGRILYGSRAGIDARFVRPGLNAIIPVDDSGELLAPESCLVYDTNSLDVSGTYKFGDGSPVETAWRQSSEYPFILQLALALMVPADYFGCNLDNNLQVVENDQIVFSDTGLRAFDKLAIHGELDDTGNIIRKNSYLTWIAEFNTAMGIDISTNVGYKIRNFDVRLSYKVGGYTDKTFLKVLTDQYSPTSVNSGVIIPDEDFEIVLVKSAPKVNVVYSGVIITKTADGWSVTGYDDTNPYFNINPSIQNSNKTFIKVGHLAVTKWNDGVDTITRIPYGTEFFSIDEVADFLISYGRYLEIQGFDFNQKVDEDASWYKNWDLAVREFLFYVQQGWKFDASLSVSPVGENVKFTSSFGTVDALTDRPFNTRVLSEDFKIIKTSDYTVNRDRRDFSLKLNNTTNGIYLIDINVVEYEHVLVFNNKTRFNDIIFNPIMGERQYRLTYRGFKTGDWDGTYSAAGFIINADNIEEWRPGVNYYKGDIVLYKNNYYTASDRTPASMEFNIDQWIDIPYETINEHRILSNLTNKAGSSKKYYDVNEVNLEQDADRLGKALIGFNPRKYLEDLGLTDTSQVKFYQGMISEKGTNSSINKLLRAKLDNFNGTVNVYEDWAFRLGNYGAKDSTQTIQIPIDEMSALKDPIIIEILDANDQTPIGHTGISENNVLQKPKIFDKNFIGTRRINKISTDLPNAGYARLDDVSFTSTTRDSLNASIDVTTVNQGDYIWIAADQNNQWDIYRVTEQGLYVNSISILANGVATIKCPTNHNFIKNDLLFIRMSKETQQFTGFYTIDSIIDNNTFTIKTTFGKIDLKKVKGTIFKLISSRFDNASGISENEPLGGYKIGDKIYLDAANKNGWGVYEKTTNWSPYETFTTESAETLDKLGTGLAVDKDNLILVAGRPGDSPMGSIVIYKVKANGTLEEKTSLSSNAENTMGFGEKIVISNNEFMAVAASNSDSVGFVYIVTSNPSSNSYGISQVLAPDQSNEDWWIPNGQFGAGLAISSDGRWVAVGQPGDAGNISEGYVHIYQRIDVPLPPSMTADVYLPRNTQQINLDDLFDDPGDVDNIIVILSGRQLAQYNGINENTADFVLANKILTFIETPAEGSLLTVIINNNQPVNEFIGDGSTSDFVLTGSSVNARNIYALLITVGGVLQVPFRDYTFDDGMVSFTNAPSNDAEIVVMQKTYFDYVGSFTADDASVGDRFGASLAFSDYGYQLIIGAPNTEINGVAGAGRVYVYDRLAENFIADGNTSVFSASNDILGKPIVYLNNRILTEDKDYTQVDSNSIKLNFVPDTSAIIRLDTNNIINTSILDSSLSSVDAEENANFGQTVNICHTNCSVYVSAPAEDSTKVNAGKVYRFVNQGRAYGTITGSVSNATVSQDSGFFINDYPVNVPKGSNINYIVNLINESGIPGIFVEKTAENKIRIYTDIVLLGEKLLIHPWYGSILEDLGLDIYVYQQTIKCPIDEDYSNFGRDIAVGPNSDVLVISADKASSIRTTTFDNNLATFDNLSTNFTDKIKESGAAWVFELINNYPSSVNNPPKFIVGQKLISPLIDKLDQFGASVAMNAKRIYVGMPGDDTHGSDAGLVASFINTQGPRIWELKRNEIQKVDINLINKVFLFNKTDNEILTYLDYVDPSKGKILGLAAEEITYRTAYDPAVYQNNEPNNVWGKEHVGEVWWDVSQTRWLDYEQGDIDFKAANWGGAFPGSTIYCYEWIESKVPPTQFADPADRTAFARSDSYNLVTTYDSNTGIAETYYYYWVAGKLTIPNNISNRKYSTVAIENMIANPRGTDIPFIAFIGQNAFALYNVSELLQNTDVCLSIDYDIIKNDNVIHSEFQLISQGDSLSTPHETVINKLITSLAGSDDLGNAVPDVTLKVEEKYGIEYRPRQTMFVNRTEALRTAIVYINKVLAANPIIEMTNVDSLLTYEPVPVSAYLDIYGEVQINWDESVANKTELGYLNINLFEQGFKILVESDESIGGFWTIYTVVGTNWVLSRVQSYDTRRYIDIIDWIKPGEIDYPVTDYLVDYLYQVQSLALTENQTVKVRDAGNGKYMILKATLTGTEIIKLEKSTLKLSDKLWDIELTAQGFDHETFDIQLFDDWPTHEIRFILRAIYNDILIDELAIEKNSWFMIMINYLLHEQQFVDYVFKTSFIKVEQVLRGLTQIPVYQKDNQDSLRSYIEEIKPYHTKIREFVTKYIGLDQNENYITDFDVPASFDDYTQTFRSPTGLQAIDFLKFDTEPYLAWYKNYTLELSEVIVINGGSDYTAVPKLTVSGNGSGAEVEAVIVNGQISKVVVTNPGSGYTLTPTIITEDTSGFGAILVPVMTNTKIRRFKDTLKFDRIANNGGFLIEFKDSAGDPVDIRNERISRITGDNGVIDELIDILSSADENVPWLVSNPNQIIWPVPLAPNYRIFNDASGRMQIQYKKIPGGWTAQLLEFYIQSLAVQSGYSVGVNGLDISGTTVKVDGNMALYAPTILEWQPDTRYDVGDVITYNNRSYTPKVEFTTGSEFDTSELDLYDASLFESHLNRTWAYYQPVGTMKGKELGQLFAGVEYPGVKVIGPSFREEPGFDISGYDTTTYDQYLIGPEGVAILDPKVLDTTIYSNFLDTTLGTKPEDIVVNGGSFVDPYASHAPEEMVPGRVYDTLDFKVYTQSSGNITDQELDLNIILTAYEHNENNATNTFSYNTSSLRSDTVWVFINSRGYLYEGTDYTVDYTNREVTLAYPLSMGDKLYIYNVDSGGQGLLYEGKFTGDGITKSFLMQVNYDSIKQTFVTVNGIKVSNYTLVDSATGLVSLVFDTAPAQHDSIQAKMFWATNTDQIFTEVHTQVHTVSAGITSTYIADGVIDQFLLPEEANTDPLLVNYELISVTVDDVLLTPTVDYILNPYDGVNHLTVTIYTVPPHESVVKVNYSNIRLINLDRMIGYATPLHDKILVDIDGQRLRPPNQAYYVGDGSTIIYDIPTTANVNISEITYAMIEVSIDGVKATAREVWELSILDGSTLPTVIFLVTPTAGSEIVVSYLGDAEYSLVGNNKLLISSDVELSVNKKVRIVSFTNHDRLAIRTQVFTGINQSTVSQDVGFDSINFDVQPLDSFTVSIIPVKEYVLSRPVNNIDYLRVSVDTDNKNGGQMLYPYDDFTMKDPTTLLLRDDIYIDTNSVIVVTHFGELAQKPAIGFRIFKDLNDNFNYYRIAAENTTRLAQNVDILDTEIYLEDASVLPKPNRELSLPGAVIIGSELIYYYELDLINNKIGQLRRGVLGTGTISTITAKTYVYDISPDQLVPDAHTKIWYNSTETTASDGNGLQNSTTPQAKFLLEKPTIIYAIPYDPQYVTRKYVSKGYVEGNLYD